MAEYSGRKAIAKALGYDVKEGRGRMARDVAAAVDKAIAAGTHTVAEVERTPRVKVVPASGSDNSDKPVKADKPVKPVSANAVVEPAPQLHSDDLKVFEVESGKRRSNREACCNCRVSLQWCSCHLQNPPVSPMLVSSHGIVPVRLED